MNNDDLIKNMTFKEFKEFCTNRACDGRWSMLEAMAYISVIQEINSIKIKYLGFIPARKKTEQAREEAWQKKVNPKL